MWSQLSYSGSPSQKRLRRSSSYGPSQASSAGGRKRRIIGRLQVGRAVATRTPVFTETFDAGTVNSGTVGVFQARMSNIAELADYTALYRSYKILKLEWIVMPDNNVSAPGNPAGIAQLAYAVDTSSELATPGVFQDVLNNNAVRFRLMDKVCRIKLKPVAAVAVTTTAPSAAGITLAPQWLSLDTGTAIQHNGVTYALSANPSSGTHVRVFCKVTFACKDPR